MKQIDLFEMLKMIEGNITPIGETNYDRDAEDNLDDWFEFLRRIVRHMISVAKNPRQDLASVRAVSNKAKNILVRIRDYIDEELTK
jgi:hypothetical protein